MRKTNRDGRTTATITDALRKDIINGAIAPGDRLNQQALARRFSASRMPVRQSLQALANEGLVIWPTGHSARAAPLDPDALREISEMRMVAESLAMRLAIPELSERDIARAEALQDAAETGPPTEFAELNAAFHEALLAPCNRPRLLAHIRELQRLSQRYLFFAVNDLDYGTRSHEEHRKLLSACRARDADAACRLIEHHISAASAALLLHLAAGKA